MFRQLLRILTKLQARMSGAMKTAPASIGVTAPRSSIEDEDLNKVSEEVTLVHPWSLAHATPISSTSDF